VIPSTAEALIREEIARIRDKAGKPSEDEREGPEKEKPYDPKSVEERWYAAWMAARLLPRGPGPPGDPFSIVIPPTPNVTGSLHMGHALNIHSSGRPSAIRRMNGPQRPLASGNRPCRDRHPERG